MKRLLLVISIAALIHGLAGRWLGDSGMAAQLLSPGPHAIVAGAVMLAFLLLRLFVILVAPALFVAGLVGVLERWRRPVVR